MADKSNKSSVNSGSTNKEYASNQLGGYPEKKSVEAINKVNSPGGRKKAPGSVRV
ncbi:MAG: hypothetical protein WCS42_20065 [Verrucomicrobiota bacterium]